MTGKPDDIPMDVWEAAKGWSRAEVILTAGSPRMTHAIARAIMAAEKRGEEREREACAQIVLDYPPEGFNAALYERTERHDEYDPFWKFEGDTGNWAALMGEVLKPYAAAIRQRSLPTPPEALK